ncbi:PPM-type phosphatase-like domain [Dillenia turbinata]|uniref:protein-serine/threonine phosphatase n=1 Tax=Dillenia turbinata TaxID=194707 RepID=A0AAN8UBQ0_9MAGN
MVNLIKMGIYLSTPKTEKFSEDGENDRVRYGLSSMQGWRATMEDAHAAHPDLDASTSFFGVYDGHGGKVVAKFCAKYLHQQVLKSEAYSAGDLGTSVQKAFFRMDEMMRGQRGWRELAVLGMLEGFIWSPRSGDGGDQVDDWAFEEEYKDAVTASGPHSDFSGPTSGSTACVAIIRNNQLLVANAGDSRCVISRKGQVELCEDDEFIVLACDGIWDCMSSQQLVDFIHEHLNTETKLSAVCEKVMDKCLAPSTIGGEGCDNMTMVLVQFKKPGQSGESAENQSSPSKSLEVIEGGTN